MELFLVKLIALIRPLASTEYAEAFSGVFGVGMFGLALAALLVVGAVRGKIRLSAIDFIILAFSVWCVAIYVIYFDSARIDYLLKLLIPLIGYTVVKNVVQTRAEYRRILVWILIGSSIPALLSAVLILAGSPTAVDMVNYWTGVVRWEGVYDHSHTMGHVMTLLIMTIVVYVTIRGIDEGERYGPFKSVGSAALNGLGAVALYCLYMSQVRTSIVGLLVFGALYLFFYNRKALAFVTMVLAVTAAVTFPSWFPALAPEIAGLKQGAEVDVMELGSGRPSYWAHDIKLFMNLPIDRQLAGVGIGAGDPAKGTVPKYKISGHNDWIEMLLQTGLVGLLLFVALQLLILRTILKMPGRERYMFLSLALAVDVMMWGSNSYAWRIQVSQLYYMVLAFIELPVGHAHAKGIVVEKTYVRTTEFIRRT